MTKQEYTEKAQKLLELLPDANYVAVDCNGEFMWYRNRPNSLSTCWAGGFPRASLGYINIDFPWQESLVEKRWMPKEMETVYIVNFFAEELYDIEVWRDYKSVLKRLYKMNMVFRTKEEAIARAKQMLGERE